MSEIDRILARAAKASENIKRMRRRLAMGFGTPLGPGMWAKHDPLRRYSRRMADIRDRLGPDAGSELLELAKARAKVSVMSVEDAFYVELAIKRRKERE